MDQLRLTSTGVPGGILYPWTSRSCTVFLKTDATGGCRRHSSTAVACAYADAWRSCTGGVLSGTVLVSLAVLDCAHTAAVQALLPSLAVCMDMPLHLQPELPMPTSASLSRAAGYGYQSRCSAFDSACAPRGAATSVISLNRERLAGYFGPWSDTCKTTTGSPTVQLKPSRGNVWQLWRLLTVCPGPIHLTGTHASNHW